MKVLGLRHTLDPPAALDQPAEARRVALPDVVVPDRGRVVGALAAGEGEEPLALHGAHAPLPVEDLGVLGRVEVGRVRYRGGEAQPWSLLHHEHRHVLHGRQTEELVAPLRVAVRLPLVVVRRPPGEHEVVAAAHGAPLGPPREPVHKLQRQGILHRRVVAPQVLHHVEAGVEGHEQGGGAGGVVGEALVLLHPEVDDVVEPEVVRGVPPPVGEHAVRVVHRLPEPRVGEVHAHVDPRVPHAALREDVFVEPRRQVVDVHVPPLAGVVVVSVGAPLLLRRRRERAGASGRELVEPLFLLEEETLGVGGVVGGDGDDGCVRRAVEHHEMAVDDEEPGRGGQSNDEEEAGQPPLASVGA
jgi:hypothetical protein